MPGFSEVANDWLVYKKPNIRESTFIQYQGHVQNHLKPYFGKTKISRVNFNAIEKYMAYKIEQGMTPPTLKKTLITLGGILKYSVRKRYIDYNPVREIEKPRGKASEKKKIDFLTPEEILALINNTRGQKYKVLFTLAVMTGMRQGELLGLKWSDIDWRNNQIRVKRTYNYGRFYEPKSEKSIRSIDMDQAVIHELKKWRLACLPNELDLVFPNENGKPMDYHNVVKRHFWPALSRAGIRRIRFHDLRHAYATLLIDQGEHPKYIQIQMGHSSINVTMDTYGHLMNPVNKEASSRLYKKIFGKSGNNLVTKTEKRGKTS